MGGAEIYSPKRIAIVEDDSDISDVLVKILERQRYRVSLVAGSGEEILSSIKSGKFRDGFDLLIADYRLPGINGIDVAKEIAHLLPKSSIIISTADDTVEEEARRAGFSFILKPFGISKFVDLVKSSLSETVFVEND